MSKIVLLVSVLLIALAVLLFRVPEACGQVVNVIAWMQTVVWIEWARVVFDLAKGVAWPLALFMFAWFFRHDLKARIKDLVAAGPAGVQFQNYVAQPTQPLDSDRGVGHPNVAHELTSVSTLMSVLSKDIEEVMEANRVPVLIRHLAEARVVANFEFIFGIIFASQINALRELKRRGKVSITEAIEYYETEVRSVLKPVFDDWDFDKWSAFIFTQGLISIQHDSVELTDLGRDFIIFLDTRKQGFVRAN